MKEQNNPCYQCPDRHVGCHSECEKYQTWNAAHIELNRQKRSAQELENMYRGYCVETTQRNRRCREHGTSKGKVL